MAAEFASSVWCRTAMLDCRAKQIDVSFNVFWPGNGMVKAIFMDGQVTDPAGVERPPRMPMTGFWLRAGGEDATQPGGEGRQRESPTEQHALLYFTATIEPVLALFKATGRGEPIQVGVRLPGEHLDRVYFGQVRLTEAELQQIRNCP